MIFLYNFDLISNMTTTDHFQKYTDYYSSKEECYQKERERTDWNNKYTSNIRYGFKHTHFTAGDSSQFEEYRDATNGESLISMSSIDNVQIDTWQGCDDPTGT